MTRKPTTQSVTEEPCRCGYLMRASEEPTIPVVFDEEMREYHIAHQLPPGAYSIHLSLSVVRRSRPRVQAPQSIRYDQHRRVGAASAAHDRAQDRRGGHRRPRTTG